jgi:hypothetical protein
MATYNSMREAARRRAEHYKKKDDSISGQMHSPVGTSINPNKKKV